MKLHEINNQPNITVEQIIVALKNGLKVISHSGEFTILEKIVGDNGIQIAVDYDEAKNAVEPIRVKAAMRGIAAKVSVDQADVDGGEGAIFIFHITLVKELTEDEIKEIESALN